MSGFVLVMRLCCTCAVDVLYVWWLSDVVLYWRCTGFAVGICILFFCLSVFIVVLVLYLGYIGVVLAVYLFGIGFILVSHWWCIGVVLVLHWCLCLVVVFVLVFYK